MFVHRFVLWDNTWSTRSPANCTSSSLRTNIFSIILRIAKTEGWLFNVEDYMTWASTFEKFWFYLAIDKETQEAVGSVSLAFERSVTGDKEGDVYIVGMYYVRPDWRGSGVGSALFDKVTALGGDANMVLHGVIKMSPRYASKYGYDKMPNYQHIAAVLPADHIVDFKEVEETKLIAYDAKAALNENDDVVGICAIRTIPLSNDLSTGPFYTDNEDVAGLLLEATVTAIPNIEKYRHLESLYPGFNEMARRFFEKVGGGHASFHPFTQCAFTKKILPLGDERVFGLLECSSSFI
ncbi:acetyltransferase, GNAT family [Oesophagostomum dentatum]|uniref:Acetyltransferase, GNAT family n=1 Tax=Oesophagostomum dentatum TaxID=61180 RepID=A0A0B1TT69_OESDE|nr:acetyltransferase, GNAT family [Oesophagostomum dentatum]